jgi:hypothetical protein
VSSPKKAKDCVNKNLDSIKGLIESEMKRLPRKKGKKKD